jgi:signal transduction histidine kinase
VAGIVGLAALIISIIVSVKVGRSIVARLARLRGEALEMADERLPTVVRRLQRGESVDVDVETPPLEYGSDEIGQLGHAFNEVQRTAVQSAVEEANVRRGINEVFLNIARRSQTLLHRQLALLDRMERRETKPDELEDLYRVDHLATRMRRHAEDLVILAGAAPGRGWRNPVPIIDVVRGAISEVEEYKRVDIRSIDASAVLGRAVGDVIHLLAELLENAASFSPPTTRVVVGGQVLPNGYAIEIEDRGLGMSPEAIEEANRKLVEPPDFDPANSARLGLFVVAQLANRHGIRISLRSSAFGGVSAIVLIPGDLITAVSDPAALPSGAAVAGHRATPLRHRAGPSGHRERPRQRTERRPGDPATTPPAQRAASPSTRTGRLRTGKPIGQPLGQPIGQPRR